MTKKLSFERKSSKSFKNHLMIEVNDVLNNILLEDEDHPSYQLNDAINRFKTEISDVDVKFIKTIEPLSGLVRFNVHIFIADILEISEKGCLSTCLLQNYLPA